MYERILVVDDDIKILELLIKVFTKEGYEVYTATRGADALKVIKEVTPDLIILDVMMPGMDGGDVVAKLLKDDSTKKIPIVYLTGAISEEEAVTQNKLVSGRKYISKTSSIKEQLKKIKEILDANGRS